jgi:hypothetical protein
MKRANKDLIDDQVATADENNATNNKNTGVRQGIRKDLFNIIFLTFLYLLQCVPLGLSGSLPYILSSRKISYSDQGTFSLAFWPFSLKLLW